jgi:hypothetical protein
MLVAPTNRRPAVYQSFIGPSHRTIATDSAGILSWTVDSNLMSVFLKIKTELQFFVRSTNIRCLQNSSTDSAVERCGQTDRHNIPLMLRSGLYMSLKGHVGIRVFRHSQCSMGVSVMCPLWKHECKSWSHYVRHNYIYIHTYIHNYSMGSSYVFSFHGLWCL